MGVKLIFAWYDFWVGIFWDANNRRLYIFPIPMIGMIVQLPKYCADCNIKFTRYSPVVREACSSALGIYYKGPEICQPCCDQRKIKAWNRRQSNE